ncbi:glycosyltransferase family 4 protein [Acidiferrimicrobium sp. IK]|uniref:glycosyltransferase family 4 protein n=1 Tax=Acidiferrimicrobium sp. IK TaxID=2871700 RepID=UPI0021CB5D37|nr:glycosyltransferase family 4 protein [Acidiferrimicrobium sp. IK]MCU4182925.1 glycosyltransferase family 4 protein [Acidiferrimicrobium sp. IK]
MSALESGVPAPDLALLDAGASLAQLETESLEVIATGAGLSRVEMVAWRDMGHPEAGGSELHAARIAERWASAGIDVTMKASRSPGHQSCDTYGDVRLRRPAGRYSVFPAVALGGRLRSSRGRPDGVVEIWNGVPFFSSLWAGCAQTVFLHHVHDGMWDLTLPAPLAAFGRFLELRVAPPFYRNAPIVTLSESSRDTIVSMMGFDKDQIRVIHPGVDPFYAPGGTRAEHPLFVAVGRLMPYKRYDVLIDALAAVHAAHPTLEALIVGTGPERAALQARIDSHGAAEWLRMPGFIDADSLRAAYRRAWAVMSASAFEGWGMTLTEAAACRTPAIASAIAGHSDAVWDGRSGLLFEDRAQLEAALRALVERPALRARLQEGAAQRASALSWDRTALGTLQMLALDAHRRRAAGSRHRGAALT